MSNFGYVGLKTSTGATSGVLMEAGAIVTQPYTYSVAEGDVTGHSSWSKIGYNSTITTNDEDVWSAGGVYVFPTTASVMDVASSDATADEDIGTQLFAGTSDTGGTTTTMLKSGTDFTATAAAGDYILIDKAGTTPEWGVLTAVANGSVTFAGGLSSGGSCATARTYQILDSSVAKGAMAVKIDYLDSAYAEKTEIITLNKNTAVSTVGSVFRINSFRVIACGSKAGYTNAPMGNLSIKVGAVTYSYITLGFTRARNSAYTVPAGKTLYITSLAIGASTPNNKGVQTCRIVVRGNIEPTTKFRGTGLIFYTFTELLVSNEQSYTELSMPLSSPAKTDIKVSAIGLTGFNGSVTSSLRGWIE